MAFNIAIDGPAGAGKSSIAKLVAKKLNYVYVDTGAMFRTMAYYFLTNGIDTTDENAVNEKCQAIDITIQDGRDIGTVVLPNAECKIYLTASSFVRANRRYKELTEKGETCDLAQIEKDIIARDEQDMNREIAPLKQAEDAVYLDSSDLTIDEVVNKIIEIQGASAHDN